MRLPQTLYRVTTPAINWGIHRNKGGNTLIKHLNMSPPNGFLPSAPAHAVLGKVPRFDEFGQVRLDGGAVRTGLLFGLRCGQLAMRPDQGQQIDRELWQQLGHHFFAFNFFTQTLALCGQR